MPSKMDISVDYSAVTMQCYSWYNSGDPDFYKSACIDLLSL